MLFNNEIHKNNEYKIDIFTYFIEKNYSGKYIENKNPTTQWFYIKLITINCIEF